MVSYRIAVDACAIFWERREGKCLCRALSDSLQAGCDEGHGIMIEAIIQLSFI